MEIVSLDDCKPFVTKDGSIIRELLAHRNSKIRNQSLAEAVIPAGTKTDAHYHRLTEEIYFITAGTGTMYIGEESRRVKPGDAIAIQPESIHWIESDPADDLHLLCCCAPGYEHDDTIMI